MQERCALLEEENRRLRDGMDKGLRPEEDDLVRLQLEALLAEKSRLANEIQTWLEKINASTRSWSTTSSPPKTSLLHLNKLYKGCA